MSLQCDGRPLRRSVVTSWAACILAVTFVGCAAPSTSATAGTTPVTPASASNEAPTPIAAAPTGPGVSSLPWALRGQSADGRTLSIAYAIGDPGCVAAQGFNVNETISSVTLTNAQKGKVLSAGEGCNFVMTVGHGTITLKAPLGKRHLDHARLDKAWAAVGSRVQSELAG